MARRRATSTETGHGAAGTTAPVLGHVLVVGGTLADWDALGAERWAARRSELAKVVAHAGATWLTIRPYEHGDGNTFETPPMVDVREGCTVVVDPSPDGRARLLDAIRQLADADVATVDEALVSSALMAPAPAEPDLVVVLGPSHRLPPSLVWELAYSELVFIDARWDELAAAHLERAIDEFSRRHRRFGGIE